MIYRTEDLTARRTLMLRSGAIIPVNKPLGWTSFDVVNKFRITVRQVTGLKRIKVGHAGTLDPQATGVLVLCTGRATKLIELLMDHSKEYVATLKFGATTPSFDTEYPENHTYPYDHISQEVLEDAIGQMEGEINQQPPLFSAVQLNGLRAYDLARQGEVVELQHKKVTIHQIELLDYTPPLASLRIACGRGTYIRSIARDLGYSLSSGAYLTRLERTRSGAISLDHCFDTTQFEDLILQTPREEEGFDPLPSEPYLLQ